MLPTPAAASSAAASGSTRKIAAGSVSGAFTRCLSTPVLSPGEPDPVLSEDSANTTGPPLVASASLIASSTVVSVASKSRLVSQNFWAIAAACRSAARGSPLVTATTADPISRISIQGCTQNIETASALPAPSRASARANSRRAGPWDVC